MPVFTSFKLNANREQIMDTFTSLFYNHADNRFVTQTVTSIKCIFDVAVDFLKIRLVKDGGNTSLCPICGGVLRSLLCDDFDIKTLVRKP